MKKYLIGVGSLIALLLVILVLAFIPQKNFNHSSKPIRVVTSLDFYGEAAKEVAGKYGDVTSIINKTSVDPHDYSPTTKDARTVNKANIVIENGLGYDSWLSKLTNSSSVKKSNIINVGQQVAGQKMGDNEHVWYNPSTMKKLTTKLAEQYSKVDPKHKSYYHQNAQQYLKKLNQLDQEITKVKSQVGSQRDVAVSEPVFDYALEALGYHVMDQHFEKAIESESDPSPKDLNELRSAITNHQIAFFVDNSQTSDKVVNNLVKLANENNVPVLKVTESKPHGLSYTDWMIKQYRELSKIQTSNQQ